MFAHAEVLLLFYDRANNPAEFKLIVCLICVGVCVESLSNVSQTKMPRSGNARPNRRGASLPCLDTSDAEKNLASPKKTGITFLGVYFSVTEIELICTADKQASEPPPII